MIRVSLCACEKHRNVVTGILRYYMMRQPQQISKINTMNDLELKDCWNEKQNNRRIH